MRVDRSVLHGEYHHLHSFSVMQIVVTGLLQGQRMAEEELTRPLLAIQLTTFYNRRGAPPSPLGSTHA